MSADQHRSTRAPEETRSNVLPPTTAGIAPETFHEDLPWLRDRRVIALILALIILAGGGLRMSGLGVESLGEDELNKLETVNEYRQNGLTGKNGEHPFLMKGLQWASLTVADLLNTRFVGASGPIREEAALRFPVALFGTFTPLLLFLLVSELFGRGPGVVAAVLWALEPSAVGFDRIAKEDSLALFFLLLSCWLWVKGQTGAERGEERWVLYAWGAGVAFAAMMAAKYYPHMLGLLAAYYIIFRNVPSHRWELLGRRWLVFLIVMGLSFLVFNPTILLPDTWHEMAKFSSEKRIGHDSYEFMGELYRNQMTAWLGGVPWTFYYVFMGVKLSLTTLALFLIGLPLVMMRRWGDGRFFLLIWAVLWFMPFTVLGGKFTRYFAMGEPLVLIIAAIGFCGVLGWLGSVLKGSPPARTAVQAGALIVVATVSFMHSLGAGPHYRLFTNALGGGMAAAGTYFPHDEFYDGATREVMREIAGPAAQGATIATETPAVYGYYARQAGRDDLRMVSLSDHAAVAEMKAGDVIVLARGRRYFSNTAYEELLRSTATPVAEVGLGGVKAAGIYRLDEETAAALRTVAIRN